VFDMTTKYDIIEPAQIGITSSKVTFDDGALKIEGFGRGGSLAVEIRLESAILVRIADEGARLRLLQELEGKRGLVLIGADSGLLDWLMHECMQTRDLKEAKHFIVVAGEEIIDVVSFAVPEIEIQN